ncbi:hypothetical protein ACFLSJ_03410 [Verrucomicrobiota bacterium]
MNIEIQNRAQKYTIDPNGRSVAFVDLASGVDYCRPDAGAFARVRKDGKYYDAIAASFSNGVLKADFGECGISAEIRVEPKDRYILLEVAAVRGNGAEELVFLDVPLTLKGSSDEPFSACLLSVDLQTRVGGIPGLNSRLEAVCYRRFGFEGAGAALIACPPEQMRDSIKEAVSASPGLPHSSIGGPWAMDAAINKGSYLFNFGNVTEETVDDWIRLAGSIGFTQLDFHGGRSFRHGDFLPDPEMYPRGFDSLKAVIDKLHQAGIAAGLHTYAFFIDKRCPWVTPVPDPRLGDLKVFTLAEDIPPDTDTVPVNESAADRSTAVGFFVRNSVTLRIDDELIRFDDVNREPPYGFTKCERGAHGTTAAAHQRDAEAHHLKECFGLLSPDGDSGLLEEVAAKTAEAFNRCGFDMIYLDALDGGDILEGKENEWHYGAKFVFEIHKHLKKDALMEMSTFYHHLWYVRSRLGAWDHPTRSHKKFIDLHCEANENHARIFMPSHLGWWAAKNWFGAQGERTFPDDFEYLCCKCIGHDCGFSLMGIDPSSLEQSPAFSRLTGLVKRYETLRNAGTVSESVKARLREPGKEFTLVDSTQGRAQFLPVHYAGHKVEGGDERTAAWKADNPFHAQQAGIRIEALMTAGPYDSPDGVVLADFADTEAFADRETREGVTADLAASTEAAPEAGSPGGIITAESSLQRRKGAWVKFAKTYSPWLNLIVHTDDEDRERSQGESVTHMEKSEARELQALGVWVHGDGRGELINLQLRSAEHATPAIGDHYIPIDFTGWRYFELVEPEGERFSDYEWPYQGGYHIYREKVDYSCVAHLGLWLNNLPPAEAVACRVSPIKALPLVEAVLRNPAVTINGTTVVFPVELETGSYIEFLPSADCKVYGKEGEPICEVQPEGPPPVLRPGRNTVAFTCEPEAHVNPRAKVTIISRDADPLK